MANQYDALKERALANITLLFDHWKIDYKWINDKEIDFINPTRKDQNYGACRFNVFKNRGSDFAGYDYKSSDFSRLGKEFTKEDFAAIGTTTNQGFDIISLCGRLRGISNYSDAAKYLRLTIKEIEENTCLIKVNKEQKEKIAHERAAHSLKMLQFAQRTWGVCGEIKDTIGELYLSKRGITVKEPLVIKFKDRIYNKELQKYIPTLLFKVQVSPEGPLIAIHRIYLTEQGNKANLISPKMALGSICGAGIWFGEKYSALYVTEGPENALSIRELGEQFAVSTISAANMCNLIIPDYVHTVVICPDPDEAGKNSALKAAKAFALQNKIVKIAFPPEKYLSNGKLADWNDIISVGFFGEACWRSQQTN